MNIPDIEFLKDISLLLSISGVIALRFENPPLCRDSSSSDSLLGHVDILLFVSGLLHMPFSGYANDSLGSKI